MTSSTPPPRTSTGTPPRRTADRAAAVRILGGCTLIVSVVWSYAAYRVFRHILHLEFVAIWSMAISMGAAPPTANNGRNRSTIMIVPEVVEPTAHVWLALMWVTAAVVAIAGLIALLGRRRARRWNLSAATSILGSTVLTLVAIVVLIRWGGFPPTIKPLGYLLIVAVQSAYAWVLLLAFLRPSR